MIGEQTVGATPIDGVSERQEVDLAAVTASATADARSTWIDAKMPTVHALHAFHADNVARDAPDDARVAHYASTRPSASGTSPRTTGRSPAERR